MDLLASATVEQLEAAEGIGRKTAEAVAAWMERLDNRDILARLHDAGLTWQAERHDAPDGPLTGRTFLITGRLDGLSRGQAEARLRELGARIAPGMSKAVDYLIVGVEPGSKLDRAMKLGTPVQDEAWLVRLLESGSIPPDPPEADA
jgi:DNA ligase (NAD+)